MDALVLIEQAGKEITEKSSGEPLYELANKLVIAASQALSQAETVYEMKDIRDKLDGIETYLKRQKAEMVSCNLLTAQRLRTEREIGRMLDATIPHPGGKPSSGTTVLSDYGISRDQSSQWQRLAQIEDADFELWVVENVETKELTRAALLRVWKMLFDPSNRTDDYTYATPEQALAAKIAAEYTKEVRGNDSISRLEALIWIFRYAEPWYELMGCGGTRMCILRNSLDTEYIKEGWIKQLAEKIKPLSETDLDDKMCEVCEKITNSAIDIVEEAFLYG